MKPICENSRAPVLAPTASTSLRSWEEPKVPWPGPSLPSELTKVIPESMAACTASADGSLPSAGMTSALRLQEMMSTFWSTSHWMPRMNWESQPPLTSMTLAMSTLALGAMPETRIVVAVSGL